MRKNKKKFSFSIFFKTMKHQMLQHCKDKIYNSEDEGDPSGGGNNKKEKEIKEQNYLQLFQA